MALQNIGYGSDGEFAVQKEHRLLKREDFNKVYRYGKSTANRQFVLYYMPQHFIEHFRLGISVSKKIGNAVVRNRLRRMIKEIVRHHKQRIVRPYDFIIIVRKPAVLMDYAELQSSILHVLKRASLLERISQGGSSK